MISSKAFLQLHIGYKVLDQFVDCLSSKKQENSSFKNIFLFLLPCATSVLFLFRVDPLMRSVTIMSQNNKGHLSSYKIQVGWHIFLVINYTHQPVQTGTPTIDLRENKQLKDPTASDSTHALKLKCIRTKALSGVLKTLSLLPSSYWWLSQAPGSNCR